VDVLIDVYPYERAGTNLGVNLPRWAVAGETEDIATRIEYPATRSRIVAEMKAILADQGYEDYSFAAVAQYLPNPAWNGKTISEINLLAGKEPTLDNEISTILEMMLEGGAAGNAYGASMIYHYMSLEDVDTILRYPNAIVASDGGVVRYGYGQPHPRSYGTNASVLANFVPERVSDMATFADPHQYSEGFDYVIVNGATAVANGVITDECSGEFVRGPGYLSEPQSW
jgi:N-acyl-D-amino-acid deacylase